MRRPLLLVTLLAATTAHAGKAPKPTVSFETPTVTGALDAKSVSSTMKRNASKFLACYKRELSTTPDVEGTKIVELAIEADGKVSAATIVESNAAFDKCLIAAVTKLRFAKPKDGQAASVSYGLTFKSGRKRDLPNLTNPDGTAAIASLSSLGDVGGDGSGGIAGGKPGGLGAKSGGGGLGSGVGLNGRTNEPTVSQGTVISHGDLDKEIIRRYMKRNLGRLRYCYEKELVSTPKLSGTVVADFVIGPDGIVSASTATGLHANVDACVASVFKTIEFPRPKNNSSVSVKYPLTFRPAD